VRLGDLPIFCEECGKELRTDHLVDTNEFRRRCPDWTFMSDHTITSYYIFAPLPKYDKMTGKPL
jgi:hypothetical protein